MEGGVPLRTNTIIAMQRDSGEYGAEAVGIDADTGRIAEALAASAPVLERSGVVLTACPDCGGSSGRISCGSVDATRSTR